MVFIEHYEVSRSAAFFTGWFLCALIFPYPNEATHPPEAARKERQ